MLIKRPRAIKDLRNFTGILNQYIELEFRKHKMYGCHEINKFVVTIYRIAGKIDGELILTLWAVKVETVKPISVNIVALLLCDRSHMTMMYVMFGGPKSSTFPLKFRQYLITLGLGPHRQML